MVVFQKRIRTFDIDVADVMYIRLYLGVVDVHSLSTYKCNVMGVCFFIRGEEHRD